MSGAALAADTLAASVDGVIRSTAVATAALSGSARSAARKTKSRCAQWSAARKTKSRHQRSEPLAVDTANYMLPSAVRTASG